MTNVRSLCEQVAESKWRFMYVPQEIQAKTSIDYLLLLNKLVLITAFVLKKILFQWWNIFLEAHALFLDNDIFYSNFFIPE
jgi:hypothetical protein